MNGTSILAGMALVLCSAALRAEPTTFTLATAEEGRKVLGARDAYIEAMAPLERGARLGKRGEGPVEGALDQITGAVREWSAEDKEKLALVIPALAENLRPYVNLLPEKVLLVKSSGDETYGDAYTRSNAIVVSEPFMRGTLESLRGTLIHEAWHVISRHQPALRDAMYAAIGFEPTPALAWTLDLDRNRVANPDCPVLAHAVRVRWIDRDWQAMIFAYFDEEAMKRGYPSPVRDGKARPFPATKLLLVKPSEDGKAMQPMLLEGEPVLLGFREVDGFLQKVGANTGYMLHPEEIIAENFRLLVLGKSGKSPELLETLKVILESFAAAGR